MEGSMTPTLSERIVACLLGLAKRIEAWAEAHPDAPLAEQAWAVLGLVRAALPALLEAVLLACTPGLSEPGLSARQPCPGCGTGRRAVGRRGGAGRPGRSWRRRGRRRRRRWARRGKRPRRWTRRRGSWWWRRTG